MHLFPICRLRSLRLCLRSHQFFSNFSWKDIFLSANHGSDSSLICYNLPFEPSAVCNLYVKIELTVLNFIVKEASLYEVTSTPLPTGVDDIVQKDPWAGPYGVNFYFWSPMLWQSPLFVITMHTVGKSYKHGTEPIFASVWCQHKTYRDAWN